MPTYDYVCDSCEHALELFQSFKEAPKKKCPQCGKLALRRVISGGVGLVFKGSGFYVTDNRGASASATSTSNASTTTAAKTSEAASSTTSEKKTSSSKEASAPASTTKSEKAA